MALALSASLAQNKQKVQSGKIELESIDKDGPKYLSENKVSLDSRELHPEDNTCKTADIIMPNASCWWKKPISPTQKNLPFPKRPCNRKYGKTKLESISDAERNLLISEKVSHILAGSSRYVNKFPCVIIFTSMSLIKCYVYTPIQYK